MHIEEIINKIQPLDEVAMTMAQARFDALIKPVGSLAKLEVTTSRYAGIIGKYDKMELEHPLRSILVWSDVLEAESAVKLMHEEMPLNVLAESVGATVHPFVVTAENEEDALEEGATLVQEMISTHKLGLVGFGSTSKSDNEMVVAAMAGGMLMAASLHVPIILDGVTTCKAAAKAAEMAPLVLKYCFAGHVSAEKGAEELLQELKLDAPLRLKIPDGLGEGVAVAMSLFDAGIRAYREMETFEEAGVHAEMKDYSRAVETKEAHWER